MRVAYILYNERPMSGLLRTQVMSLLCEIKRQRADLQLVVVALWQPWIAFTHRAELRTMQSMLRAAGIELKNHFVAVPSRLFLRSRLWFAVAKTWARMVLRWILRRNFDIVHSRAYFASVVVGEIKDHLKCRSIFDMRSLFADEHVSVGTWTKESDAYRMWKVAEAFAVQRSDASVGVSMPMIDDIRAICDTSIAVYVPLCVDTSELNWDPVERNSRRAARGWEDKFVVAYVGSLAVGTWNNITNYARYFSAISSADHGAHFLVITQSSHTEVARAFVQYGISADRFTIVEARGRDLAGWLSAADAGIHVMSSGADSHTRLGVKFVEYLSCGLPVLLNEHAGAAAQFVSSYGVGWVIDLDTPEHMALLPTLRWRARELRQRSRDVATRHFSVESCAARYVQLYDELLQPAAHTGVA
jgi:glycosyltransferase involved in cell wall biosynthesis